MRIHRVHFPICGLMHILSCVYVMFLIKNNIYEGARLFKLSMCLIAMSSL